MLNWWRGAPDRQRKLAMSVAANLLTRVPALVLLLLLPRLRHGLGTDGFALLFASLALGAVASIGFTGFATMGLRAIGDAVGRSDRQAQADGFMRLVATISTILPIALALIAAVLLWRGAPWTVFVVALMPVAQAAMNAVIDTTRLAFNEHYITATLGLIAQVAVYAAAFTFDAMSTNIILAGAIFHLPLMLASVISGAQLLTARSYLLSGHARDAGSGMGAGIAIGAADGLMPASLSLILIWLERVVAADVTAWFALQIRLYQMLFSPILMVLVPVSSFLLLTWAERSHVGKQMVVRSALVLAMAGGMALGVALLAGGSFYAAHFMNLAMPQPWLTAIPIFLLFGALAAYRIYSQLAYLVLDGLALAKRAIAILAAATVAAAAASPFVGAVATANVFMLATATMLFGMLAMSVGKSVPKAA